MSTFQISFRKKKWNSELKKIIWRKKNEKETKNETKCEKRWIQFGMNKKFRRMNGKIEITNRLLKTWQNSEETFLIWQKLKKNLIEKKLYYEKHWISSFVINKKKIFN